MYVLSDTSVIDQLGFPGALKVTRQRTFDCAFDDGLALEIRCLMPNSNFARDAHSGLFSDSSDTVERSPDLR